MDQEEGKQRMEEQLGNAETKNSELVKSSRKTQELATVHWRRLKLSGVKLQLHAENRTQKQIEKTLEAGRLGITCGSDGIVKFVDPTSQACNQRIKTGMKIVKVNDRDYEEQFLRMCAGGKDPYKLTVMTNVLEVILTPEVELGFEYRSDGRVTFVVEDSPAQHQGIQIGMWIAKVGDAKYDKNLLQSCIDGKHKYSITLQRSAFEKVHLVFKLGYRSFQTESKNWSPDGCYEWGPTETLHEWMLEESAALNARLRVHVMLSSETAIRDTSECRGFFDVRVFSLVQQKKHAVKLSGGPLHYPEDLELLCDPCARHDKNRSGDLATKMRVRGSLVLRMAWQPEDHIERLDKRKLTRHCQELIREEDGNRPDAGQEAMDETLFLSTVGNESPVRPENVQGPPGVALLRARTEASKAKMAKEWLLHLAQQRIGDSSGSAQRLKLAQNKSLRKSASGPDLHWKMEANQRVQRSGSGDVYGAPTGKLAHALTESLNSVSCLREVLEWVKAD